ncbi:MAG TPA: hypothetical protein PKC43_06800 [Phycisphaerales bacterium]|nr:hypothetical protein [Phycisphaerales bacterium]HMP37141.1 hypothetical protein [Phycisphaerales bacterium]
MVELITALSNNFGVFMMLMIFAVILTTTVVRAVVTIASTNTRERSRREIAAYIAEGSITPDQGERLLKTAVNGKDSSC